MSDTKTVRGVKAASAGAIHDNDAQKLLGVFLEGVSRTSYKIHAGRALPKYDGSPLLDPVRAYLYDEETKPSAAVGVETQPDEVGEA